MSTYYFLPTRNVFGEGSVQEAGVLAKTLNVKKILIVTDAFLAKVVWQIKWRRFISR
jgi:alcohol dehydrogenase